MYISSISQIISFSLLFSFVIPDNAKAYSEQNQSFKKCALGATEMITVTQLFHKGLSLNETLSSLPGLNSDAKERIRVTWNGIEKDGLLSTYSQINSRFAQCAKEAYQSSGKPAFGSEEYGYYYCSGENKKRYEIILAIHVGGKPEEVIPQVHPSHQPVAEYYYAQHASHGTEALFDMLGDSLKSCINQIYQ